MGLFSFLTKKKPEGNIPVPPSPAAFKIDIPAPRVPMGGIMPAAQPTPSPRPAFTGMEQMQERPSSESITAPRQVDDFGIPAKEEFELPDIEMPRFKLPTTEEKAEISQAIESEKERPAKIPRLKIKKVPVEVPEELPEIGAIPKTPRFMIPEGIEEPVELREIPKVKGPVFMRADKFMNIKTGLNSIKDNLKNMETVFADMTEIKDKQDADIDVWHGAVESIQRKLVYVDKTLFEK